MSGGQRLACKQGWRPSVHGAFAQGIARACCWCKLPCPDEGIRSPRFHATTLTARIRLGDVGLAGASSALGRFAARCTRAARKRRLNVGTCWSKQQLLSCMKQAIVTSGPAEQQRAAERCLVRNMHAAWELLEAVPLWRRRGVQSALSQAGIHALRSPSEPEFSRYRPPSCTSRQTAERSRRRLLF